MQPFRRSLRPPKYIEEVEKLVHDLCEAQWAHEPVFLLGTAFAFVHLFDHCDRQVETPDDVIARVETAMRYVDKERITLHPDRMRAARNGHTASRVAGPGNSQEILSQLASDALAAVRMLRT